MKIKNSIITLSLTGFFSLNSGLAYSDLYLGAKTGKTWLDLNACQNSVISCKDNSSSFGLFLGNTFNHYLSLEADYDYIGNFTSYNFNHDNIQAITLAAKLSQTITDNTKFYTKIGGAFVDFGSINDDRSYLGAVGFEYSTNENWDIRLEYQKLFDISNNQTTTGSNTVTLGVSYKFNKPEYSKKSLVNQQENIEQNIIPEVEPIKNIFESKVSGTLFEIDSAELKPEALYILDDIMSIMTKYPQAKIIIIGHTDSTGSEDYNKILSEKRAQSVAQALMRKGLDPRRYFAEGLGMSQPIASNDTPEGRLLNRRVEVVISSFEY
ncbi:OmpA family protein [Vibrio metschnikovii]|nr:OmpA family protein [Vibrio metschnikovii]